MQDVIRIITVVIGPIIVYWTTAGVIHTPELFQRMSSTAKAVIVGIGGLLLIAALYLHNLESAGLGLAIVGFVLLIAPPAAYVVDHTVYSSGIPQWNRTTRDDLPRHYDPHTHGIRH